MRMEFASPRLKRELRELRDPAHPRVMLSPACDIEHADAAVRSAAKDEEKCHFCPNTHPLPPDPVEEGVTDADGAVLPVEDDFGLLDGALEADALAVEDDLDLGL